MKRILLLLVAVTALSCSSDDSSPVTDPNQVIVGTWLEIAAKTDPQDEWVYLDCSEFQLSRKYTFNSDGTYTMVNGCDSSIWPIVIGTYTVEGNVVTFTDSEGSWNSHINVISESQVSLQDFSEDFQGSIELFQKQ